MKKTLFLSIPVLILSALILGRLDASKLQQKYGSSLAVYDRNGVLLRMTLANDQRYRLWENLENYPSNVIEAVKLKEDQWFDWHIGFNPIALIRSAWMTYVSDRGRYGGSTITMQLARLYYDLDSRSLSGKLRQVFASVWLEWLYSKNEILEAYLNLVPLGRNIEGYTTGAYVYFRRPLSKLTLAEILALVQIPQNPMRMSKISGDDFYPQEYVSSWKQHFVEWIKHYPQDKNLAPSFERVLSMRGLDTLPFYAPHFTTRVLLENTQDTIEIKTSLDLELQNQITKKIERFVQSRGRKGIKNASAMVMRWTDGEVLANIGSSDFFNDQIAGQVDGTRSKRSPGSTLKPFLYALAFEQGIIHPESMVFDLPQDFSAPGNIDGDFLGPLTASEALAKSRNIPAADLLRKLSDRSLYDFLKMAGISEMKEAGHYGTSLVMGSLDVTMQELVGLYGILASNGLEVIPTWELDKKDKSKIRLLSQDGVVLVKDILKKVARPDGSVASDSVIRNEGDVYWKTGTSVGFRDAWSVGIWGEYVVAVWVGDFSGAGHPEFMGIKSAAPLFFQIVDGLRYRFDNNKDFHHSWTQNIVETEVCSLSGNLPSKFCPLTKKSLFIPGVSPIHVCEHHRLVEVLADSGERACEKSKGEREFKTYEFWNSQALEFFKARKLSRAIPPDYAKECSLLTQKGRGNNPKILSPRIGLKYQVPLREKTALIPLQAIVETDVKEVFWFVGKKLIARIKSDMDQQVRLPPGHHLVKIIDDHGRATERFVTVQVATN